MAKLSENSPLQGLSGTIEELTFKRYKKKTVVTRKSARRKHDSVRQALNIGKFAEASRHARAVLRDPVKREHYRALARKLEKHSAYNLIISEYMLGPRIERKKTANAKRLVLTIAKKAVKIKSVTIKALSNTETELATGTANQISTVNWVYTLPNAEAHAIIATLTDALGQTTTQRILLE